MQAIAPVTNADLLAKGQRPLLKLEINIGGWIDITALADPVTGRPKNYLQDVAFRSGGARMTPDSMAGEFSASISNEGNIFHPNHPTSPYTAYFQAGREVRISLGGNYTVGGVRLWQRIIGHIDEPEFATSTFVLTIKGLDYMRVLSDTKFTKEFSAFAATPIDNMWGTLQTRNSLPTSTLGAELYTPPGGDAAGIGGNEANSVANWAIDINGATAFASVVGTVSAWEIKLDVSTDPRGGIRYAGVCAVVAGQEYYCTFRYARTLGDSVIRHLRFNLVDGLGGIVGAPGAPLNPVANGVYETCAFTFTPTANANLDIIMWGFCRGQAMTWRVDEISIRPTNPPAIAYYNMPAACTGIYHVELNGTPEWPGKQKGEGWYYDFGTNRFWFDIDKVVVAGVANLDIYYYTAHALEDVVADILAKAGLYANRAAALAAMGAPATGINVDRVRFDAGSPYVKAINMICERCNYRFYFNHNGIPIFVTAPVAGAPVFATFNPQHFTGPRLYQERNEIKNRIVIEGEKLAELTGWEDNMPSELKDEAFDAVSIAAYGELTKAIKNLLFQDLASITAMCATLLAAYKDPKWYFDFETPYNAVPLVLGDTVLVQELLDIAGPINVTHTCLIRNADVSQFNVTYKCQI